MVYKCIKYGMIKKIYICLDESGFNMNLTRGMSWSKKGQNPSVVVPASKVKHISLLAIMGIQRLIYLHIKDGPYNTLSFTNKVNQTYTIIIRIIY